MGLSVMTNTIEPITDEERQLFLAGITKGLMKRASLRLTLSYEARLDAVEAENKKLREALSDSYPLAVVHAVNYARVHNAKGDFVEKHAMLMLRIAQLLGAKRLEEVARNALSKGKDDE